MDAPEMAVTPAPAAGQLRQSPDGANSSVIDATSTCGGGGGGRGSVANLDNVVDEETAETPLLVSMKLMHYSILHTEHTYFLLPSPLTLIFFTLPCAVRFLIYLTNFIMNMYNMRKISATFQEPEANENLEKTVSEPIAPKLLVDNQDSLNKRAPKSQTRPRQITLARSKSQETVEKVESKKAARAKECREKSVPQERGSRISFLASLMLEMTSIIQKPMD